ncbi:sigma-54 dependent transcriptional regulator [soil metagenome]
MNLADPSVLEPLRNGIPRVLVVDDEPDLRELLELTVLKMGCDVEAASSVTQAHELLARKAFSLCLTDMRLPDGDGIDLVRHLTEALPGLPVAVITAFGSTEAAVAALKAGAFDFLSKPVALEQLRTTIMAALQSQERDRSRRTAGTAAPSPERALIGEAQVMVDVRNMVGRLARSMAPVAIYGESGTGKEVAARAIHGASARAGKRFVAVNCGAIPDALMEAEFFGYRKGAFTGADADRDGFFQAANGGTLLLDEIAELPLAMQVKLLRAIQERRVRKVGATVEEPVDVRIISATHRNLPERVAQGSFRQDLFYRLNVIELRMPALRDREGDIELLSNNILRRFAKHEGRDRPRLLSPEAASALRVYPFPGNVRELENILERASAFAASDRIEVADLGLVGRDDMFTTPAPVALQVAVPVQPQAAPALDDFGDDSADEPVDAIAAGGPAKLPDGAEVYISKLSFPMSLPEHLEAIERAVIERALEQTKFNRTAAAKLLGVTFRQLRYRMQQLGIR